MSQHKNKNETKGPASTCPACNQMIQRDEAGKLVSHPTGPLFRDICLRSGTHLSRAEDSFAEHILSDEESSKLKSLKPKSAKE